ncbi:hypothetical protein RD792_014780 [Penstemon davidsonii]|uniref:Uncharacterized protein n=1 Tax=Penstemon davidsonii TaxID=160366 RepID=A0ABR0CQ98_9LAMI|nr:hypothetical protein RD792_014780 [Penstemon davidsonii]
MSEEVVGSKGIIKRDELVRILGEALYSLGYKRTGDCLEAESGIQSHSRVVKLFIQKIIEGKWDESLASLHGISIAYANISALPFLLILEQKFFRLLEEGNFREALKTLRDDITPRCHTDEDRIRELSVLLLRQSSVHQSRLKSGEDLLEELQNVIPPVVMLRKSGLVHLVEQVLLLQRDSCRFHNSTNLSLFTDHHCGKEQIPSESIQVDDFGLVSMKHQLSGHAKPVSCISWSPNDDQLLTCGEEERIRRWDIATGECLQIIAKPNLKIVSCAWGPDGNSIFFGVRYGNVGRMYMWDLQGNDLKCWKTPRNEELGITDKELITILKNSQIIFVKLDSNSLRFRVINENQPIVSFALSEDSKFLLVSLSNQEIHLWNIDGPTNAVLATYRGHKRSRFVVRSCFGGLGQAFIASGSEDSQVYIWHRDSGELILKLGGHSGVVNCVSWNPVNPHMLASGSDDRTIRIWGLLNQ